MTKKISFLLLAALVVALLMAGCSEKKNDDKAEVTEFVVKVIDESGSPVEGVAIQVCDDDLCSVVMTDSRGKAKISPEADSYQIHVLKVPEGYAGISEEFTVSMKKPKLEIILSK